MTNKRNLVTVIAAGVFAASVAARAQYATIPDPNLAPTTTEENVQLVPTPAVQLAALADPNLDPSTEHPEVALLETFPDDPQLAVEPDPNFGEPAAEEVREMQASRSSGDDSAAIQNIR